jgi:hypothetical protein
MPGVRAEGGKIEPFYPEGFGGTEQGPYIEGGPYILQVNLYARKGTALVSIQTACGIDKIPVRRAIARLGEDHMPYRVERPLKFFGKGCTGTAKHGP